MSYLCTSTPTECLFSSAGNIASKKRASLSPERVDNAYIFGDWVDWVHAFASEQILHSPILPPGPDVEAIYRYNKACSRLRLCFMFFFIII